MTSSLTTVTSAWAIASTVAVAASLAASGSAVSAETSAVLTSGPGERVSGTVSTRSMTATSPAASAPIEHVTVVDPVQPAGSGVTGTVPAGIDSVSVTPSASDGPSLVTASV